VAALELPINVTVNELLLHRRKLAKIK